MPFKTMKPPKGERQPLRCKYCNREMEFYGELNGIIGWHPNYLGINTDSSEVCSVCRVKELRGELGPRKS